MTDRSTLETRIGVAISNGSASSDALIELIAEASAAAEAAEQAATAERNKALDVVASPDVGAAHAAVAAAALSRDRLAATVPRLRQRLSEALSSEHRARWLGDFQRVEKLRDQAAAKFARQCPEHLAALVGLMREADAVDQEVSRVNSTAPGNERRLRGVELHARNLTEFSTTQPSISQTVRLPDYQRPDQISWPLPQPHFAVTFAQSMVMPRDVRHSADWWRASEADAAARREIAERREIEQRAADAQARADYERTLLKAEEEREARAQAARRRG
jgi:hypothetical protein